jgi:hypothetical protein
MVGQMPHRQDEWQGAQGEDPGIVGIPWNQPGRAGKQIVNVKIGDQPKPQCHLHQMME